MVDIAFKRQKQILDECKEENEKAHKKFAKFIEEGRKPVLKGTVVGPYTTRESYWFDNNEFVTLIKPSSLHWVPFPITM